MLLSSKISMVIKNMTGITGAMSNVCNYFFHFVCLIYAGSYNVRHVNGVSIDIKLLRFVICVDSVAFWSLLSLNLSTIDNINMSCAVELAPVLLHVL